MSFFAHIAGIQNIGDGGIIPVKKMFPDRMLAFVLKTGVVWN